MFLSEGWYTFAMPTTPILLVTGFLGSGKTTFINWLLTKAPDHKMSIILNEFGDIKLESQFISRKDSGVIELSNGCMCCVAKSDIPRVLRLIVEQSPQTQTIVIEASGLSDPDPIFAALQSPEIGDKVRLDMTVCVIDALNFEKTWGTHAIMSAQVGDADVLVLSKTVEAGEESCLRIESKLASILPSARIVRLDDSVTPEIFLSEHENTASLSTKQPTHDHHHEEYTHYIFEDGAPMDAALLVTQLRNLPTDIIRAKGVIYSLQDGKPQKTLLQLVGTRIDFLPSTWESNEKVQNSLLFIGKSFNTQELEAKLHACRTQIPGNQ